MRIEELFVSLFSAYIPQATFPLFAYFTTKIALDILVERVHGKSKCATFLSLLSFHFYLLRVN
jgi:hypothetical protein